MLTHLENEAALVAPLRMVFVLRYEQDVSTEATARLLGLSVPAVKTRLLRAPLKMRERLSKFVEQDSVLGTG